MNTNLGFATQFGESVDMGLDPQQAFPFIYTMYPKSSDDWTPGSAFVGKNMLNMAVPVDSPGKVKHYINLDPDLNFKLLQCKFGAYTIDSRSFTWNWYDFNQMPGPVPAWEVDYNQPMQNIGTDLLRYIRISLSFSHNGQYLFGGQNIDPVASGLSSANVPVSPTVMQGQEYGRGSLRTEYILPRQGTIEVEITNSFGAAFSAYPLYVTGLFYGMKVRV